MKRGQVPQAERRLADPRRLAFELGLAFAQHSDLDGLVSFAVAKCRELLDAAGVAVLFVDRERNELYFPYASETDPVVAARVRRARLSATQGIAGNVLRNKRSERVDDASLDPRFFAGVDELSGLTTGALICAPLLTSQGPLGVIEAVNPRRGKAFTDDDLILLDVLAQSLAGAIEHHLGLGSSTAPLAGGQDRAVTQATLCHHGEYWTIGCGTQVVRLKDMKGLRYLAFLLRDPGTEFHVLDLVARADGRNPTRSDGAPVTAETRRARNVGGALELLDATAKRSYRERLVELQAELEEAEAYHDSGRADRARAEMESIALGLSAAVGLGGRDRNTGSHAERARSAVTRCIKDALHKIEAAHPVVAEHLHGAVRTGYFCSYAPGAGSTWRWKL